jgi:hypothetical protein
VNNIQNSDNEFTTINPTEILVAEFNYIAESAFQANEDRARVSQFFFVTFATFIAAIFSSQLEHVDTNQIYITFAIVFLLVSMLGALTLLQLARLRQAWLESALAMNQIKDRLINMQPELGDCFRWTNDTLPPAFKVFSVGSILAIMVALLSGLAIGSSIAFYTLTRGLEMVAWFPCISAGIVTAIVQTILFYWLPLKQSGS